MPESKAIHGSFAGPPDNGVRFELALREASALRAVYVGHAHLCHVSLQLTVIAELAAARATLEQEPEGEGRADIEGEGGARVDAQRHAAIEKAAAALVRAATRAELTDGAPVPSKIVRWRSL